MGFCNAKLAKGSIPQPPFSPTASSPQPVCAGVTGLCSPSITPICYTLLPLFYAAKKRATQHLSNKIRPIICI